MTKPCYEEYANHALRFYAKNPALSFNSPGLKRVDIDNWNACNDIMRHYSEKDRAVVLGVFRSKCAMQDAVTGISSQLQISENGVWQLISRAAKDFAKRRGLI